MRLAACLVVAACTTVHAAPSFTLEQVAPGVHVAIRTDPPGLTFVANMAFIVNDNDVVAVDTGVGGGVAKEAITALKAITAKPVRYVVNTHWHDDHMMGNAAFRDAWPGVEFIGHANARAELESTGAANRRQLLAQGPAFAKQIREALAAGNNLAGKPASAEERLAYASDLAWAERYFAEAPDFQVIAPTLTLTDHLRLQRGSRIIDIRWLGRAHTASDLVVHLPNEGVLITGDLVVAPVPLFGSTSFPADYADTLEKMLALKPAVIVPGHGPVMRDDAHPRRMIAVLRDIGRQVKVGVAGGLDLPAIRRQLDLASHKRAFAGDSAMRQLLFDSYVVQPGTARMFAQVSGTLQ